MFENWKTFLFMDEQSPEYCGIHSVKRVKMVSKLGEATIGKGFVCPRCEMKLVNDQQIILRIDDKWIPVEEYAKQEDIVI